MKITRIPAWALPAAARPRDLCLPRGFIAQRFTLGELQGLCEKLLGERLDKSSFRRRLAERDLVEPAEGEARSGPNRPTQMYRLKDE